MLQPERLRDEEIDHLEQQLRRQALGPAQQLPIIVQEEPPLPSNCFKFQNKVFGELRSMFLVLTFFPKCVSNKAQS